MTRNPRSGLMIRSEYSLLYESCTYPITDWVEWQTNVLTAYLLLPRELIDRYMDELGLGRQIKLLNKVFAPKEYALFSEMAKRLGVSKTALSIRLDNLGMIGRNDFSNPYAPIHIYRSNFDATKYLEKFFDFQFAIPYADYKRFLRDRLNLNLDSITEHICTAVIRQFDFSLRQSERYVRIMKIVGVNDACENAISQEDKATAFVGEYIMPILVGLQMYNLDVYYEFKAGRNAEPMIKILSNPEIPKCRFLLGQRETFAADGVIPSSSSGYVVMKDRLQTAYDALFLKTDRIKVGQMTFTDRTRAYLNETESMLIPDGNFDFE